MAAPMEVLITSESSGLLWTACVWDFNTGTSLMTYKGGVSAPHTLCILGNEYLISAVANKPLIHLWALQRKDQMQLRMVCSGPVTALTVSPDGLYCVAAVHEKIHVWQVCSGNLMVVLSRHYQNIQCIKFTDDGSHFISAGEDNLALVWSLASIFSESSDPTKNAAPKYVWSQHSLAITDLHVGYGGSKARVVTASLDQTCRIWELSSGRCLCCILFDVSLYSVCLDPAETRLFAGGADGNIYQANLFERPVTTERHIENNESNSLIFKGHSKRVKCLSVTLDGTKVVSGSEDFTVKVWDISSHQCVRTINHKGAVTNAFVIPTPYSILNRETKPSLPVQQFKRHLHVEDGDKNDDDKVVSVRIKRFKQIDEKSQNIDTMETCIQKIQDQKEQEEMPKDKYKVTCKELKEEVKQLKQINSDMYQFSVTHILKNGKQNKKS